jgi:hypothetical protein
VDCLRLPYAWDDGVGYSRSVIPIIPFATRVLHSQPSCDIDVPSINQKARRDCLSVVPSTRMLNRRSTHDQEQQRICRNQNMARQKPKVGEGSQNRSIIKLLGSDGINITIANAIEELRDHYPRSVQELGNL